MRLKTLAFATSVSVVSLAIATSANAQTTSSQPTPPADQTKPAQEASGEVVDPAADGTQAPAADDATSADATGIVVTGYRQSLQKSLNLKRRSDVILDAISADDIASFPEANIAESLQRIPGISIDRDNGEGRQISVRGLGGDFTRVRVDGMEALSTTASLISALSTVNQSRSFDFNTFASELFSQASVRKTTSAETDEGSLGATVDLNTPRPFDFKGQKIALGLADAYYTNGKKHSPRVSALYSNTFFDDRVGIALSGAYQKRDTIVSNYKRGPVNQGDLLYRGQALAGNEYLPRAGFAVPTGTVFNQSINTTATGNAAAGHPCPGGIGVVCNVSAVTNPQMLAALSGSDPTAYAALYPSGFSNAPARYDDSTVIIPSLPGLAQQRLKTERIGLTGSLQFQISDGSRLTLDGLYSKFDQVSDQVGIEPVGLGRNNTNATLNTLPTGQSATTLRGLYPQLCTFAAGSATSLAQDCGQSIYGGALAPGYQFSFNPNNLDPYDYYNNPLSPGYAPNAYGINGLIPLIGRPTTKVVGAQVTNGVADYLALQNVDWRSQMIRVISNTEFKQFSGILDQRFSDTLSAKFAAGWSNSKTYYDSTQVEFNALDRPETFIIDAREGGKMPIFNPGFDVANPTNWGITKGLSVMRDNRFTTDTTFKQARADFSWEINDQFTLLFGASYKQFDYAATGQARSQDGINPTEKEAGVSVASLGQTVNFGQGLKLPDGTPTTFFVPNIDAFANTFGFNCNCINKYGDFRLTGLRSNVVGQNYQVTEKDKGGYFQVNFKNDILGRPFSGNFGVRVAGTEVVANGLTLIGAPISDSNKYTDFLPSLNLTYEPVDDVLVRFAVSSAMSRPQLAYLSPSITGLSIPTAIGATTGGTLSVGNTRLNPYRSTNFDLAVEWYFRPNSVISIALFDKEIGSYPQLITFDQSLSSFVSAEAIAALRAQFPPATGVAASPQQIYLDNDYSFAVRQIRDAPGGYLRGIEFNFQTDFWFLPGILKNFGVQLNATKIESSLNYILDPGLRQNGVQTIAPVYGKGPFLNASPEAVNFTFYYEDKKFTARTSLAWRSDYFTQFPIQPGTCAPGSVPGAPVTAVPCQSPLMNDFVGARGGMNVDAVMTYAVTDFLTLRLEGLNLTNKPDQRFAYTANPQVTNYASSGTQITFGARFKF